MKIGIIGNPDKRFDASVISSFCDGLREHGDVGVYVDRVDDITRSDAYVCIGVKDFLRGRELLGHDRMLMLDKAIIRVREPGYDAAEYVRLVPDIFNWSIGFRHNAPSSRFDALGIKLRPKIEHPDEGALLVVGSSEKYHNMYKLVHPTDYAQNIFTALRRYDVKGPYCYRPKPSWSDARPIDGTHWWVPGLLTSHLSDNKTRCVIAHGSSGAIDALIYGVPAIILGHGSPACAVCDGDLSVLANRGRAYFPDDDARYAWASSLAWAQWTRKELANGSAWEYIKPFVRLA